jgi:neutral ceramidase
MHRLTRLLATVCIPLCVLLFPALGQPTHAATIEAGIAQADITPPVGGMTTGYSAAKPTTGIHDPLSARVLILKANNTSVAIVSWDLCIVNSPWLFEQVKPLGIDHLVLMNTHTHAGPKLAQEDFPSAEAPWRQTVERRVLAAIKVAQQSLFPAYVAADEGSIQLGYNRLVRQRAGYSITHFENPDRIPYGPVDPTVGVIRITDQQGATRVILVSYACHPVVLGPRNRQISADYPGVMRRLVEQHAGGNAVCIFVQGGCGDINPLAMARSDDRDEDFAVVERLGKNLADEVIQVLDRMQATKGQADALQVASAEITVADRWDHQKTLTLGVTSLLINHAIGIMTMPGEPFHQFQVDFRGKANVPHAYFFGYACNGPYEWPDYLPDIESAARGGYGASDTTHAEVGSGERLLNLGLAQIYRLQGRLKDKPQR